MSSATVHMVNVDANLFAQALDEKNTWFAKIYQWIPKWVSTFFVTKVFILFDSPAKTKAKLWVLSTFAGQILRIGLFLTVVSLLWVAVFGLRRYEMVNGNLEQQEYDEGQRDALRANPVRRVIPYRPYTPPTAGNDTPRGSYSQCSTPRR